MKIFLRIIVFIFSIAALIVGIIWLTEEPNNREATISLLLGVAGFAGLIIEYINSKEEKDHPTETIDQHYRHTLLTFVENKWINTVLARSIHGAAMIELGKHEDPDAVSPPWKYHYITENIQYDIPDKKPIIEILYEIGMGKGLLILGEPGSGKTITLLDLTKQLISVAKRDSGAPLPVVFSLSRWALKRSSLDSWLVEELNLLYGFSKTVAWQWIKNEQLVLLLDGLDEVSREHREGLVEAINKFHEKYRLTQMAVCSRTAEYRGLGTYLNLEGAIVIQDLNHEQISKYLDDPGQRMKAVRATLLYDHAMRELAKKPLFLSIMVLAYRGMSIKDLKTLDSLDARRGHLLDTYIRRMFDHKSDQKQFLRDKTVFWLVLLAKRMISLDQTLFFVEDIQPDWLPNKFLENIYHLMYGVLSSLIWAIPTSLLAWIAGNIVGQSLFQKSVGLQFGVGIGIFVAATAWIVTIRWFNILGGLILGFAVQHLRQLGRRK